MGIKADIMNSRLINKDPEIISRLIQEDEEVTKEKFSKFLDIHQRASEGKYSKYKETLLFLSIRMWADLDEVERIEEYTDEKAEEVFNEITVQGACPLFDDLKQKKKSGYYDSKGAEVLERDIKELVAAKDELSVDLSSNDRKIRIDKALHSSGIHDYYEYLKTRGTEKKTSFSTYIIYVVAILLAISWLTNL